MRRYGLMAALLAGVALVGAMSLSAGSVSSAAGSVSVAPREPGATMPLQGYAVKVYFSRHPVSDDRYGAVFALKRVSPTRGVATFALRQLLAGPTPAEASAGYYTEWTSSTYGPSSCGPLGFTLRLNRRGAAPDVGTATMQLCRRVRVPGIGASARMTTQVQATLLQFASVHRVVILTATKACFGDLSGLNRCLRPSL